MFNNIYANKKVLITGHTGFKGSWLAAWLNLLNAQVYGISKNIPTRPSHYKELNIFRRNKDFFFDVKNRKKLEKLIKKIKPDFIFHLAAQSIVSKSYTLPIETWQTNVFGTQNILEASLKLKNNCNIIIITSDKCYYNFEKKEGYKEDDYLGGKDNYSASKASCEILVKSYFESYFRCKKNLRICTARAGNVIGGGDWTKDRLIPDLVKSWVKKKRPIIRSMKATRPWQHVLEAVSGYLNLGYQLKKNKKINGQSFNFGPSSNRSYKVRDVITALKFFFPYNALPIEPKKLFLESTLLSLNSNKAKKLLNWKQNLNFRQTLELVGKWYNSYYFQNKKIITIDQIKFYQNEAKRKRIGWAL